MLFDQYMLTADDYLKEWEVLNHETMHRRSPIFDPKLGLGVALTTAELKRFQDGDELILPVNPNPTRRPDMAHKHRPYTAEDLESALEEGSVTLERLAATLLGAMVKKPPVYREPPPAETQKTPVPQHGKK